MKKLLLLVLITMVLLTSCNWSSDKKIISKVERTYEKHKGYKCKANIKIFTGENETIYLIEETYNKPNQYKLEILKPKESKGIIILNTDDKVFVEHPSIDQSISLVTIKTINSQLLIVDFFEKLSKVKLINSQDIKKDEYLIPALTERKSLTTYLSSIYNPDSMALCTWIFFGITRDESPVGM